MQTDRQAEVAKSYGSNLRLSCYLLLAGWYGTMLTQKEIVSISAARIDREERAIYESFGDGSQGTAWL